MSAPPCRIAFNRSASLTSKATTPAATTPTAVPTTIAPIVAPAHRSAVVDPAVQPMPAATAPTPKVEQALRCNTRPTFSQFTAPTQHAIRGFMLSCGWLITMVAAAQGAPSGSTSCASLSRASSAPFCPHRVSRATLGARRSSWSCRNDRFRNPPMRLRLLAASAALALSACTTTAGPGGNTVSRDPGAGEAEFRGLYKELVETNTTFSVGSCTLAAERMKARLVAAGYPESDLHLFVPRANRPQDGNLVAILPGSDPSQKAILLLAHIDVVEAKREDWMRDPFSSSRKAAISTRAAPATTRRWPRSSPTRWSATSRRASSPRRTIKMVLTCGEETPTPVQWRRY